jgi:hypothetical protein
MRTLTASRAPAPPLHKHPAAGFPSGSYTTLPPGATPLNAGLMGVAAVMVGGVQMVAVTQQKALWL